MGTEYEKEGQKWNKSIKDVARETNLGNFHNLQIYEWRHSQKKNQELIEAAVKKTELFSQQYCPVASDKQKLTESV